MPCRIWNCGRTFSRDGAFRPRAGRGLHPRPERSTHAKAEKQKSESGNQKIHFGECLAAFGIAGEHSAGMELSGLEPVGGCTPDRNDPPTRKQRNRSQKAGIKRFISGNALPHLELRENIQPGWSFPASSRSGVAPPTGTIHPRESRETEVRKRESKDSFRGMPCRIWNCGRTFSRDGAFRPRAGRGLHPRPERSTPAKAGKQKSESGNQKIHFGECLAAFGIAGEHSAGVELSGLEPVGGCTPDRNDPPTRKQRNNGQKIESN